MQEHDTSVQTCKEYVTSPWDITLHLLEWSSPKRQETTGCSEKGTLVLCGRSVNWSNTMENNIEVPQKIKNRSNIWSSNSISGLIPKGNEHSISVKYLYPVLTTILFTRAQIWKQSKRSSMNEWIKKDVVHTDKRVLFSHEEGGHPLICDHMDGPWAHDAMWPKSEKDQHWVLPLMY